VLDIAAQVDELRAVRRAEAEDDGVRGVVVARPAAGGLGGE
jgi:hypothetical protein